MTWKGDRPKNALKEVYGPEGLILTMIANAIDDLDRKDNSIQSLILRRDAAFWFLSTDYSDWLERLDLDDQLPLGWTRQKLASVKINCERQLKLKEI